MYHILNLFIPIATTHCYSPLMFSMRLRGLWPLRGWPRTQTLPGHAALLQHGAGAQPGLGLCGGQLRASSGAGDEDA